MTLDEFYETCFAKSILKDAEGKGADDLVDWLLAKCHSYWISDPNKWHSPPTRGESDIIMAFRWAHAEPKLDLKEGTFNMLYDWSRYGNPLKEWDGMRWVDATPEQD